jgi:hypothetical protein
MPTPSELLRLQTPDRFQTILAASPRKLREEAYRRAGIKAKGGTFSLKSSGKSEERAQKLHQHLGAGQPIDEQVADEFLRNYLLARRGLLIAALDHLGVPHSDGLTDHDLDFIPELPLERRHALRATLLEGHPAEDVDLYLAYLNVPMS